MIRKRVRSYGRGFSVPSTAAAILGATVMAADRGLNFQRTHLHPREAHHEEVDRGQRQLRLWGSHAPTGLLRLTLSLKDLHVG